MIWTVCVYAGLKVGVCVRGLGFRIGVIEGAIVVVFLAISNMLGVAAFRIPLKTYIKKLSGQQVYSVPIQYRSTVILNFICNGV